MAWHGQGRAGAGLASRGHFFLVPWRYWGGVTSGSSKGLKGTPGRKIFAQTVPCLLGPVSQHLVCFLLSKVRRRGRNH